MAYRIEDSDFWDIFQGLVSDGQLTQNDIRQLRTKTNVDDAAFSGFITDGLITVQQDIDTYVTRPNRDFDGRLTVTDASGDVSWDGSQPPPGNDYYINAIGYLDEDTWTQGLEDFIDGAWDSWKDQLNSAGFDDEGNPVDVNVGFLGDIKNPEVLRENEFKDALEEYLYDTDGDGLTILEGIKRGQVAGNYNWQTDSSGGVSFNYYDDSQTPKVEEEEEELDYDLDPIEYDFLADVEPWKVEYLATENIGKLNPQGIDTSKNWTAMTPAEREATGMTNDEYNAAKGGETYAQEQDRIAGEISDITGMIDISKNELSKSYESVKEILDMFQPQTYEVKDYGLKRDIASRQQMLDERARFNPDPLSYQGPVQVLPEYVQPEYTYEAPEREEFIADPLEPLDPGEPYDPDYGKNPDPEYIGNDPDLGTPDGTPIDDEIVTPEPEVTPEPTPEPITEPEPEPEPIDEPLDLDTGWQPYLESWVDSLFEGNKNRTESKGQMSTADYSLSYTAQRNGNLDYSVTDKQTGQQVDWDDLDKVAKWNLTPQHIRNQKTRETSGMQPATFRDGNFITWDEDGNEVIHDSV